jgi:hypothetical protein
MDTCIIFSFCIFHSEFERIITDYNSLNIYMTGDGSNDRKSILDKSKIFIFVTTSRPAELYAEILRNGYRELFPCR